MEVLGIGPLWMPKRLHEGRQEKVERFDSVGVWSALVHAAEEAEQ
jgi:hypothetical protein